MASEQNGSSILPAAHGSEMRAEGLMQQMPMTYDFLVETYETERVKVLSVWSEFRDEDLPVRPNPHDSRGRSVHEHMVHQCISEDAWFRTMLGIDVGAPPLPEQERRIALITRVDRSALRSAARLRTRKDPALRLRHPRVVTPTEGIMTMTITETTTVADIAAALPASVPIFQQHGIDFCCGGKTPLGIVCREHGIPFAEIASAIEASASRAADHRDWAREPLGAIADHIVTTYHDGLREELPRLEAMAAKVAHVHGANAPYLARLEAIVTELADELRAHMLEEENVLFPAIRALDGSGADSVRISAPIATLEHEHDHAGALLSELRSLTGGYTAPEWGCQTVRAFYEGLRELESTMHVHVHLENNVLFPRALGLAASA